MKSLVSVFLLGILISCSGAKAPAADTLPTPTGLSIGLDGMHAILQWEDNCNGESGYYLFQSGPGIAQSMITLPENTTRFETQELWGESSYKFSLQAFGKDSALSLRADFPELSTPTVCPVEPEPGPDDAIRFNWTAVSAAGLPETVKVFTTTDKLEGRAFHAWYAIADPKEVAVRVLYPGNGQKATIDKQAGDAGNCLVLINGGIFGTAPIGFAILDGVQTPWRFVADDNWAVDKQYWGAVPTSAYEKLHPVSRGLFGVDAAGVPGVFWSFTPEYGTVYVYDQPIPTVAGEAIKPEGSTTYPCKPADWTPYNAITCGPVLLHDGECPISAEKNSSNHWLTNYELWADDIFGVNQLADRTAVGYTAEGKVILFICDGRIDASQGANTLEMARIMKGLGCKGALNLDGGGSTGMWVKGSGHINDLTGGNRAVMTTIGFFQK